MLARWDDHFERAETAAPAAVKAHVLVIGLGNPILGDDGVGWSVARCLANRLNGDEGIEVDCLAVGGLSLMERMLGYRRVILVDSIETGRHQLGAISVFELSELGAPGLGHSTSAHDVSLITALETARAMGADVPHRVDIIAVEARVGFDFTETLSPAVAAAVEPACEEVLELIGC